MRPVGKKRNSMCKSSGQSLAAYAIWIYNTISQIQTGLLVAVYKYIKKILHIVFEIESLLQSIISAVSQVSDLK